MPALWTRALAWLQRGLDEASAQCRPGTLPRMAGGLKCFTAKALTPFAALESLTFPGAAMLA